MGEPTLVVRFGDLEALEAAVGVAASDLVTVTEGARERARQLLTGWVEDSASRQAQLVFDEGLGREVEVLVVRLTQLGGALATVREAAREAEVRNVAILD